jgi:hypothetical protein
MTLDAGLEKAFKIILSRSMCVLATNSPAGPYASLMAYAPFDGGRRLVLVMEKGSTKHRNLEHDNRVSILVDTRTIEPDRGKIVALTLAGAAALDQDQSALAGIFEKRHPGFPLAGNKNSVFVSVTLNSILMLCGPEKAQFFSLTEA